MKSTTDEPILKKEEENSTDEAIDAINALSTLESRWEAPQKKKQARNRKRRKKRKSNLSKVVQTNNLDADKMHNVWIDVEDVVKIKIMNPSQMTKATAEKIQGDEKKLEDTKTVDFPPLKHDNEKTHVTEQDVNAINTTELKSYADVVARALGNSTKNHSSSEAGSEMDISDEEESSVDTNSGPEMKVDSSLPEAANVERASDEIVSTKDEGGIDTAKLEKEKLALKLAELKAKAKLANAKLRMAKQKKAIGNVSKDTKRGALATAEGRKTPPFNTGTQTKRFWHSTASNLPGLRDISALRNISTLIVEDISRSGSHELVRFTDSVYNLSSSEDDEYSDNDEIENEPLITEQVALSTNDQSEKQSQQSLKQQLHLAKLRLEIKKKEQILLEKKKKMPAVPLPSPDESNTTDMTVASKACDDSNADKGEPTISSEEKKAKLEQLRQRQKELKRKNDVSNLKNMINRQRQLLGTQSHELTENSSQLERVVNEIATKEGLLDESDKRLEEMNHRKKIMEGMMLRATEKLMSARKALGEFNKQRLTT